MRANNKITFRVVACWTSIWATIHLKNYLQLGYFSGIIKGDGWDSIFWVLNFPGGILSLLIIVPIWGGHDYPYYLTAEILPFLFNCAFYSAIAIAVARLLRGTQRVY